MTSALRLGFEQRFRFAGCTPLLVVALVLTWAAHRPLWGQTNVFPNSGNAGIGTTSPSDALVVYSVNGVNGGSFVQIGSYPSFTWQIGRDPGPAYGYGGLVFRNASYGPLTDRMVITPGGNVGIGTTSLPQYPLSVNGTIQAKEVLVNTGWSDYVFAPDYSLTPLHDLGAYIKQHHHLPEIPSAAEVAQKGVSLGDMQAKLLAKVEELTLHMIQADERNTRLERQNRGLQDRIARLETGGATRQAQ